MNTFKKQVSCENIKKKFCPWEDSNPCLLGKTWRWPGFWCIGSSQISEGFSIPDIDWSASRTQDDGLVRRFFLQCTQLHVYTHPSSFCIILVISISLNITTIYMYNSIVIRCIIDDICKGIRAPVILIPTHMYFIVLIIIIHIHYSLCCGRWQK